MRLLNTSLITTGITILLINGVVLAGGGHSDSHHDAAKQTMEHKESTVQRGGDNHNKMGSHAHDSWEKPPKEYASLAAKDWDDTDAALRGAKLYKQQCIACHGADGKGAGQAAAGLEHPPADLTSHFHAAPGQGDGYLFWRISEGGAVEPFISAKSAMPAFKTSLSETERWEVLTYIHQSFHGGFPEAMTIDHMNEKTDDKDHVTEHRK